MKKLIMIIMLLVVTIIYAQEKSPRFYVVENDTLGIIVSIADAQKIDNDLEILKIYEKLSISYNKADVKYLVLVDNLENQIAVLKIEYDKQSGIINNKDIIISDLKEIVRKYEKNELLYKAEIGNKDVIITNLNKKVRKSFWQKIGGSAVALLVISLLVIK